MSVTKFGGDDKTNFVPRAAGSTLPSPRSLQAEAAHPVPESVPGVVVLGYTRTPLPDSAPTESASAASSAVLLRTRPTQEPCRK